jgi:NitT/TauT family transport system substrate-binding protein
MPEPEFGGLYAAKSMGLFDAAGLDVEIIPGAPGVPGPQMVASGTCELGVLSADQILTTRSQGGDVVGVFATFTENPTAVMVHEASAAQSLKDVWTMGLTLTTEPGLPWVQLMNAQYGTDKVKIVANTGGVGAFMANPAAAQSIYVTSEPITMRLNKVPVRVLSVAESGYNPYAAVYSTRRVFLDANREKLRAFATAMQQGWEAYLTTPEKFNPVIAPLNPAMNLEAMNLAATIMRPYLEGSGDAKRPVGWMDGARWSATEQALVKVGILKSAGHAERAYENLVECR